MIVDQTHNKPRVGLVILAGGQGRRIGGGDKGWVLYNGVPMVKQLLETLQRQLRSLSQEIQIVISANRNIQAYQSLGVPVVVDKRSGYQGPLAGIEAVLSTSEFSDIDRWVVCPVDSPNLPERFIERMLQVEADETVYLNHLNRDHYAHLSISNQHKDLLSQNLDRGNRSIKGWLKSVSLSGVGTVNPLKLDTIDGVFKNINHYELLNSSSLSKRS